MSRRLSVETCRDSFLYEIDVARRLVKAVTLLKAVKYKSGNKLHPKQVRKFIEWTFMGVVASWEDFLEETMVRYLAGAQTKSGYGAKCKVGQATGILHAYQIISRKPKYDPEQHYISWTTPDEVLSRADFFFVSGSPYRAAIHPASQLIEKAVAIRNRAAHASLKCKKELQAVAHDFLSTTKLSKSYTAGDLLQESACKHFDPSLLAASPDIFEAYMRFFEKLAKQIVP